MGDSGVAPKKIYACFVDFRKAFDSVWRTGLFYKLIKNNMSMNFIKLIHKGVVINKATEGVGGHFSKIRK